MMPPTINVSGRCDSPYHMIRVSTLPYTWYAEFSVNNSDKLVKISETVLMILEIFSQVSKKDDGTYS